MDRGFDYIIVFGAAVGPDGKPVRHYARNILIPATRAGRRMTGSVPLALNERPGEWQLRVKDAATGMTHAATFRLKQD